MNRLAETVISDDGKKSVDWEKLYCGMHYPEKNQAKRNLIELGILSMERNGNYTLYSPAGGAFTGPEVGDDGASTKLFFTRKKDAMAYKKVRDQIYGSNLEILKLRTID